MVGAVHHHGEVKAAGQQQQQAQKSAEQQRKTEEEYKEKMRQQEKMHEKELQKTKEKQQAQYYNNPAQMTQAVQPQVASYSQHGSAPPGAPPPSLPPPAPRARLLAAYAASSPTELSVVQGEEVTVVRADPSGWTEVVNAAGHKGFVPGSYLSILGR